MTRKKSTVARLIAVSGWRPLGAEFTKNHVERNSAMGVWDGVVFYWMEKEILVSIVDGVLKSWSGELSEFQERKLAIELRRREENLTMYHKRKLRNARQNERRVRGDGRMGHGYIKT